MLFKYRNVIFFFQTLTNVLQEHQAVMLMRIVSTPRDRTAALAKLVIMETERIAKVARTWLDICAQVTVFSHTCLLSTI